MELREFRITLLKDMTARLSVKFAEDCDEYSKNNGGMTDESFQERVKEWREAFSVFATELADAVTNEAAKRGWLS